MRAAHPAILPPRVYHRTGHRRHPARPRQRSRARRLHPFHVLPPQDTRPAVVVDNAAHGQLNRLVHRVEWQAAYPAYYPDYTLTPRHDLRPNPVLPTRPSRRNLRPQVLVRILRVRHVNLRNLHLVRHFHLELVAKLDVTLDIPSPSVSHPFSPHPCRLLFSFHSDFQPRKPRDHPAALEHLA